MIEASRIVALDGLNVDEYTWLPPLEDHMDDSWEAAQDPFAGGAGGPKG